MAKVTISSLFSVPLFRVKKAKKKGGGNNNNNNNGGGRNQEDEGGKKEVGMKVVVLKIDLHCEGCASKVIKAVRSFDGVESVKVGDGELNKLTVVGTLEPMKLREKVEQKTKKKTQLISPVAKKENKDNESNENKCEEQKKPQEQQQKQQQQKSKDDNKSKNQKDENKPKELPLTTAVLKIDCHCQGCLKKIHKIVSRSKGYMEMSVDKQKDLLTVKGAIDAKAMVEKLREKMKRKVEIVPPKKEGGGDKEKGGGGDEKSGKGNGGGGGKMVEGQYNMDYYGGGLMGDIDVEQRAWKEFWGQVVNIWVSFIILFCIFGFKFNWLII